jgi:hypothetical protein
LPPEQPTPPVWPNSVTNAAETDNDSQRCKHQGQTAGLGYLPLRRIAAEGLKIELLEVMHFRQPKICK